MTHPVWRSVHTTIDGSLIDRDSGWPDVELALEPIGTALAPEDQSILLIIEIGKTKTILDEAGVTQLKAFLEERP